MALTKQQELAINECGKNIIVSAGAGSGKTKVLTERVFDRISNPKYKWNIDEMLVLTFTNAAAANMKLRIRNKINQNENNLLSQEERRKQLNKIDSSFIMTFDAYAQFLVKKYHQVLGVDKNIKIVDTNIIKNKTYELINEIFINEYKTKNKEFIKLINDFCIKDDFNLREKIIEINNKLNTIYGRDSYINNYKNNFYNEGTINSLLNQYNDQILLKIITINNYLNDLSCYVENYKDYFIGIDNLLNSKTYDEIRENCNVDHSKRMMGQEEEARNIKSKITDLIEEIKEMCLFSKDELKTQIINTESNTLYLLKLSQLLNNKIKEFKKENNMYEFSDIFEMAIELVDKHDDIRIEIKNSFKEVLIDEYQDTNDLQEEFISRIENNNVYMVGDIKQSIYRFRNANPNLFNIKFNNYENNQGGIALQLSSNFRSRKEVLDSIDDIFSRVMDGNVGGADYVKKHKMTADNSDFNDKDKLGNQSNKTEILSYVYDSDSKKEYPFNELDQVQIEAFIIAKDIKEKIETGFKVSSREITVDENGHEIESANTRPVEYKDFSILIDRGTNFDTFKQILTYCGIPADIQSDEKMDESDLITVIRAAFKLICTIKQEKFDYDFKYAYMSLARSFVIEMLDSTLYEIVTENSYKNSDLYKKIETIINNIESKTINDVLTEIIEKFDIYQNLYKIGDVQDNFVKIDYLYQLGNSLNEVGYNYSEFNDYLINVFDSNNDDTIKFKTQKDNRNAVIITNIHQSKGLEYNVCYYPLLTVKFNKQDLGEQFVFNKDLGLIIPTMIENKGLKQTIIKDIFKNQYLKEDLSERIRLFYVALTRAKEKMILICPLEDKTSDGTIISDDQRLTIGCYKDLLDMIYEDVSKYVKEINFDDYKDFFNKDYQLYTKDIFKQIPKTTKKINVKKQINIKPEVIKDESYSKDAGLINEQTLNKMELGSKIHYYLQTLDLKNPNYELIEDKYIELIKSFINSDLMKNISNGKEYKEYEFIYIDNNEKKHGFIDLLIEYLDHFDIIDYKTKNIDDEHYDQQLNGYRKYIESISNKPVECYLYSIMDKSYRKVEK